MTGTDDGSLRDQAYRTLRRRIIDVEYQPGQRLIERDLATELRVSRIPLREALRLLSAEGLVVIVPGKGTIVSPFTPRDVRDLLDVRRGIEPLAARLAAERVDALGLARLRECLDDAHAVEHDPKRLTKLNADFHGVLAEVCDNPLLLTITRPLDSRMRWLFALAVELDPVAQVADHERIHAAIAAGDPDEAARLALAHVEAGREQTMLLARSWIGGDVDPKEATHSRRRARADRVKADDADADQSTIE